MSTSESTREADVLRTIVAVTSGLRMAPRDMSLRFRLLGETLAGTGEPLGSMFAVESLGNDRTTTDLLVGLAGVWRCPAR